MSNLMPKNHTYGPKRRTGTQQEHMCQLHIDTGGNTENISPTLTAFETVQEVNRSLKPQVGHGKGNGE